VPTETATETALPTAVSTEVAPPAETPTEIAPQPTDIPPTSEPPTAPPPTATPALAPNLYVIQASFVPINPGSSPASGEFHVGFLNTTDSEMGVARWKVLIFRPGDTRSIGDTLGLNRRFPVGPSDEIAGPYRLGVTQCEQLIGRIVTENTEAQQTPLLYTDGQEATIQFQLCP
jgi:hypothetical protein